MNAGKGVRHCRGLRWEQSFPLKPIFDFVCVAVTVRVLALGATIVSESLKLMADDYKEIISALTQGQPADVAQFIVRRIDCNHWLGEEPFDDDRAKEIRDAIEQLKCQTIDQDERILRRVHAGDAKALKAINDARGVVF